MTLKMVTCEPTAPYDEILESELKNSIFNDRKEIINTINSLINQGVLELKIQALTKKEIKYLREFGNIRSNDDRGLSFIGEKINIEILNLRTELEKKYFYPKN